MSTDSLVISFGDASTAEGNRLAGTLCDALRDADRNVVVNRHRDRADTQDFGTSLVLVMGTAAATSLARGIAAWLARNAGARIEIKRKGEVVLIASHLDSIDVSRIAAALSAKN
jgi:hypothetical protein